MGRSDLVPLKGSLERYEELIKRFKGRRIAVFGDVMLDEYVWGSVSRISPEAPVPVVEFKERTVTAGGAANVAANLAALGADPVLFGIVGEDPKAETLKEILIQKGINVRHLVKTPDRPTTRKTRVLAGNQQIVRVDSERTDPVGSEVTSVLLASLEHELPSLHGAVFSDYDKGVVTRELLDGVVSRFRAGKKPVVVDPNVTHFFNYKNVTTLTPNRQEVEKVMGRRIRTEDDLLTAGREIVERLSCDYLVITRSEEGMSILSPSGEHRRIPTVAREVYDVTGAGDTVTAVLALALSAGAEFAEAVETANAAAGVVVAKRGTATLTTTELLHMIQTLLETVGGV